MKSRFFPLLVGALALAAPGAQAAFHVMQVEQIIDNVNGNPTAQAIQLRLRSAGQNLVSNAKLWAWDSTGSNRILLLDIATDVSNSASGARILLATSGFTSTMIAGGAFTFTPDFTLANRIPSSYFNAGRLTYEDDGGSTATPGTIYWSFSWGGVGYTGPTTGSTQNDADGNFGRYASALPTPNSVFQGIVFTGTSTAPSTNNAADYTLITNPTVTRNNGATFTVVPEPGLAALFGFGALSLGGLCWRRRRA